MFFFINNLLLISVICFVLLYFIKINTKIKLYKFISVSFFLHIILLLIIQLDINRYFHPEVHKSLFFNDGECYSSNAWIISNTLNGKVLQISDFQNIRGLQLVLSSVLEAAQSHKIIDMEEYQVGFITYFYSILYAAYGYMPIYINIINVIFNLLTCLIIYKICMVLFNRKTALIASVLFLFNPTTFYYSTTKLKEPFYFFISYMIIYLLNCIIFVAC